MSATSRTRPRARGLSLVELLIALVLTALVIAAIAGVFLSAQATFRTDEAMARLQENARAAAELLARDLREAGYADCAGMQHQVVVASPPTALAPYDDGTPRYALPPAFFLSAHDCTGNACAPVLPAALAVPSAAVAAGKRVPGSDVVVVRRFDGDGAALLEAMADARAPLRIGATAAGWPPLASGQLLVVSDCAGADWFRVSSVGAAGVAHAAPFNRSDALGHAYGRNGRARVFRYDGDLLTHAYFLAYAGTPEDDTAPLPALRRADSERSEELLQGVDDLQVTLLLDAGAGQWQAQSAGAVAATAAWTRVRRVDVSLVVDSVTAPNLAAEPFVFDGAQRSTSTFASGPDRRLHREVVLPVTLRNRMR